MQIIKNYQSKNTQRRSFIVKKRFAALLFGLMISYLYLPRDFFGTLHQETHMEFEDYVRYYKYPIQRHEVATPDGYILTVFRIQAKYQKEFKQGLPVVYLQHGLLDSSDSFIVNQESKAPAFMLANRGYDVWLGNFRGNKHSRSHVILNPESPNKEEVRRFWNFSFHEMGVIDIPSIFEYIHNFTDRKINFIGHSQGSMSMFVALTEEHPVVKAYINQFIALGPIAYIQHVTSIPLQLYNFARQFIDLTQLLYKIEFYEFIPSTWFTTEVVSRFCNVFPLACSYAYGLVGSIDPMLDQNDRYDVISAHIPSGTSLKNMMHFHQLISTYEFKRFDYGPEKNMKYYGQKTAPFYDLSKINIPVALFLGTEDRLAVKEDVLRLKRELSNASELYFQEIHSGHTSFMWGKDMSYFEEVFNLLETHDFHDLNYYTQSTKLTSASQKNITNSSLTIENQ
ncbi:ab-hydrolase associated lipase region protein (macronuclear) [Tetrahymena thermophila SB210]|uniref:Ab-hydrolase associated lipase region protein n=1 Tax=Tetrahymena thermophila (strain SB210) TaxID=312017 RepID=Q24I21_TETTS|nr:ab-hydrolase associated lipase region protein [Tetrahymena thermophila SB210]EAS07417.1 ab-hydrolase associated lipase region protein [Tetrahymena thermophila SB210]|eukprot:XP_001027659.1 ab-hydrolase associated lipase region protein [Tetrahymena thermophila SB210]